VEVAGQEFHDPVDRKLQDQQAHHLGPTEDGGYDESNRSARVRAVELCIDHLECIAVVGSGQEFNRLGEVRGGIGAIP
jgi:hypothetical protein